MTQLPNNQKRVVIALCVLAVLTGAYFFWQKTPGEPEKPVATATPTPIPLNDFPTVPIVVGGIPAQTTEFSIAFSPTRLPEKLATFTAAGADVIAFGEKAALSLGIKSSPPRVQSGIYYWESSGARLSAQSQPPSFSYSSPQGAVVGFPTDQEATSLADSFFKTVGALSPPFSYNAYVVQRITGAGIHPETLTTPGPASIAIVGYQIQIQTTPIIDTTGGELRASAWVGLDKKIQHANAPILPVLTPTSEVVLIPPEQALVALKNNKATLLSVTREGAGVASSVKNPVIRNATITSVLVAYFWDKTKNTLKPVYIFDGETQDPDSPTKKLSLVYILAASP